MVHLKQTNENDKNDEDRVTRGKRVAVDKPVDDVPAVTHRPHAGRHRAKPAPKTVTPVKGRHRSPAEVHDPVNIDFLVPKKSHASHKGPSNKGSSMIIATTGGILLTGIAAVTSSAASQSVESKSDKTLSTDAQALPIIQENDTVESILQRPIQPAGKADNGKTAKLSFEKTEVKTKAAPEVVKEVPPKPVAPPVVAKPAPAPVSEPSLPGAPPVALGSVWDKLAACESSGHWNINTGNGYFGGLQFSLQTWQAFGGLGNPANATREQQIMIAEKVLKVQGWNAWPQCSQHLGLNGVQPEAAVAPPKIISKAPVSTIKPAPVVHAPVMASGKSAIIAQAALSQIGKAQDCTMLVTNSLAAAGIPFHGWPAGYLALGNQVPATNAVAGDLIYYQNGGMGLAHIAVYIGNGQAVHGGWNGNQTVIFSANVGSGPVFIRVA